MGWFGCRLVARTIDFSSLQLMMDDRLKAGVGWVLTNAELRGTGRFSASKMPALEADRKELRLTTLHHGLLCFFMLRDFCGSSNVA